MSDDLLERIDAELAHAGEHHLDDALAALIGPPEWTPPDRYARADEYQRRAAEVERFWRRVDPTSEDHTIERGDDYDWTIDHAAPGHDEGFVPLGESMPVGESWLTAATRAAAHVEHATIPAALNPEWAAWRNRFVLDVEPLPVPKPEPVGNPELRGIEPATWRDQLPPETGSARARRRRHERNMRRESQREIQRLNTEWSTR